MLDLGLLGGWAAGGPVAEAGTPATNTPAGTAAPADADAAALAGSFGALIDDFAAGDEPAADDAIDAADAADDQTPSAPVDGRLPVFWMQALTPAHDVSEPVDAKKKDGPSGLECILPHDANDNAGNDVSWPVLVVTPPALPIELAPVALEAIHTLPDATIPAAPDANGATDVVPPVAGETATPPTGVEPQVLAQMTDVAELVVPSPDKKDSSMAAVAQNAGASAEIARDIAARHQDTTGDRHQQSSDRSNRGLGSRAWGQVARYNAESHSVSVAAPEHSTAATLTVVPPSWQSASSAPSFAVAARVDHAFTADSRAETLPESTAQQIVQSLRVVLSRGGGDAHIRLDPRQFGDLSVSVRVDGGHVVAQLQADTPAVREWLHANQQTLRQGLAEHDLRLERLEVLAPADEARDETHRERREQQQDPDDRPAHRSRRRETGGQFEFVA